MNLLGIDFEDWYHIELVQKYFNPKNPESKIVLGIDKILNLLEKNDTYATFFMVGDLLIKEPKLLDKIIDAGHEIAFHTMHHSRIDTSMKKEMFEDEIKLFSESQAITIPLTISDSLTPNSPLNLLIRSICASENDTCIFFDKTLSIKSNKIV